jgi:voltage-gated potassium channel
MREKGSPLYQLTLLVLSVFVLVTLFAESLFVTDPQTKRVLQYLDFGICLIFLIDFFINLIRAESKIQYLKWGWIDFLASIPAVDPFRWGRLARVFRILRYFRAIRSVRVLLKGIRASKFDTLTWSVFLIIFVSFSFSAAFILEFERGTGSPIDTAEAALWWAFLNIMNAKTSIDQAMSPEGVLMTTILNKVGLLLFAYINSMLIGWLVIQRRDSQGGENLPQSD